MYIYIYVALCSSQVCQMAPGSSTPTAHRKPREARPSSAVFAWNLIINVPNTERVVLVVSKYTNGCMECMMDVDDY